VETPSSLEASDEENPKTKSFVHAGESRDACCSDLVFLTEPPCLGVTDDHDQERVFGQCACKIPGPSAGSLSIPAGGSPTVSVRGGTYVALFRYGSGTRCSYTKVGPFQVIETNSEVCEITIVLHAVAGNTQEQASSEREFDGQ
jgi:hypothetical protein